MTGDLVSRIWASPERRPLHTSAEWEALLGQARRSRLLGRLARHHLDRGWLPQVPERPRRFLEGMLRLLDRQHDELRWELACLRRALGGLGTPVVLLKGAAYFAADLPPRHGRLFGDIDLLVPRKRIADVEGALFAAGWIGEERDAYNQRYYRQWMHEIPPLRHVRRGSVIDVHHTITPPTSRYRVDGALLFGPSVALADQGGFFVLAPPDMVLHSAVHLFQEGEFDHGLRDLLDLDDLMRHFGAADTGFWATLFDRADQLGLAEPLSHAIDHVEERFGARVPPEDRARREALRPRRWSGPVLKALFRAALDPNHPSSAVPFSGLARGVLYARSHALRMPLRLAVPHLLRKAYMRRFRGDVGASKPTAP